MNGPVDLSSAGKPDSDAARERVERLAAERGVEFVHLQFIDIPGAIKGLSIPVDRLPACLAEGVWFDGSSVEGLARLAESDLYLRPDPRTFAVIPWETPTTARVVCDLFTPGHEPFPADPRYILKRALADAAEMGFAYRVGAEVEFYLFEEREARGDGREAPLVPLDARSYFELPGERAASLCHEVVRALRGFGYQVSATHHEVSPGQYEVDLAEDDALRAADAIVALKLTVRALANRAGLLPTFMPKPIERASGTGVHLTQRLADLASGENRFFDAVAEHRLSSTGQSFIAGQLAHARGMCAVLAPLVNSYKRLLGGDEAPAHVTWAKVNRGAFIRLPEATGPDATVVEVRAPDPSCNPYLALAVLLQCGLDGIRNQLALPPPTEHVGRQEASANESAVDLLPSTLGEALEEVGWDMTVRSALGQPVFERFSAAKEGEWLAYRHHISDWELEAYLESA